MWLMTPRGFYSAVQHRDDPTRILVRARNEDDIRNLSDLLPDAEPWRLDRSDYEWRLECSAADWAKVCACLALEVDYPNFKTAVKERQGQKRASVYMRVWSALLSLEPRKKVWRYGRAAELDTEQTTMLADDDPWWDDGLICTCPANFDGGDDEDHDADCGWLR